MIYGTTTLKVREGTLIFRNNKRQVIKHHIGKNTAVKTDLGRPPTEILCVLIAEDETEKFEIEQLLHGTQTLELHFDNFYYKDVVTGSTATPRAVADIWFIEATFIALDPIPYDSVTDVRIY